MSDDGATTVDGISEASLRERIAKEIEMWVCAPECSDVTAGGECPYAHAAAIARGGNQ